jgi:hypothetical protein
MILPPRRWKADKSVSVASSIWWSSAVLGGSNGVDDASKKAVADLPVVVSVLADFQRRVQGERAGAREQQTGQQRA